MWRLNIIKAKLISYQYLKFIHCFIIILFGFLIINICNSPFNYYHLVLCQYSQNLNISHIKTEFSYNYDSSKYHKNKVLVKFQIYII